MLIKSNNGVMLMLTKSKIWTQYPTKRMLTMLFLHCVIGILNKSVNGQINNNKAFKTKHVKQHF